MKNVARGIRLSNVAKPKLIITGLRVAHFENIGFHIGSSYSKYRLFTGFSIKNIG